MEVRNWSACMGSGKGAAIEYMYNELVLDSPVYIICT